ncbi:helix-turn-helix domain-containing protein [Acetobacteraceae bacterium]|nr:helix-turn-helix domain-containing protein [Acetobacteraceae bacterium]
MSLAAIQWAWQQELPATQKLVLVAMADHANKEEGICWPSLELLAHKTGLCTRTIKTARRQLREKALIVTLAPGRYRLCHPLEKFSEAQGSARPLSQNLSRDSRVLQRESYKRKEESFSPSYKNPKNNPHLNPEKNTPEENEPDGFSLKESHFFQTWHRHEKNGFRELADIRKTNPAEARKAMISLMQNLTPRLVPMILGEDS